jgi:hypothetical protein
MFNGKVPILVIVIGAVPTVTIKNVPELPTIKVVLVGLAKAGGTDIYYIFKYKYIYL